ncbi:acyltransferase family protein [Anabaena subtropica]|uniref:Acyltransferase n=1 Tax=Anabaena subtropica FACHB-260 TaxID=2692884 RepID=A0ABR8CR44_9NOST|nr:acyltransferase [Anabaena subtropica]MBD2345353.1 acyltransferase [Anabaena subtropica FACHB-260]
MNNHPKSKKRLYTIQVLRGVAAILIVLVHCNLIFNQNYEQDFFFRIFNFGGSGVDFFFVLSGFIMLYIHQHDIGHKNKIQSFLFKRFTRIYPIYWLILSLKLSLNLLPSYEADINQRNIVEVIKAFLLLPQDRNILSDSFLGVSWTLSFELLFYLVFTLLIILPRKFSYPIVFAWLLMTISNFMDVINIPEESLLLNFLFNSYNLEFALGCCAAYLFSTRKINLGMPLIFLGAFLYTFSAVNSYYGIIKLSTIISFGIPSTFLVLGCASWENRNNIQIPNWLVYIGDASYSIYLVHGFIINNLTKIVLKIYPAITQDILSLNILGFLLVFVATFIGCIFYTYIEKPLFLIFKPKLAKA